MKQKKQKFQLVADFSFDVPEEDKFPKYLSKGFKEMIKNFIQTDCYVNLSVPVYPKNVKVKIIDL